MIEVRTAQRQDREAVSRALASAFADDPVVRWMMPTPGRDVAMFRALAAYSHAAPGCSDIALEDGQPQGAALWNPPGHHLSVPQHVLGLSTLLLAMGTGFRRGAVLEAALARARPPGEFWYLAHLGASTPGRGVGSALLERRLSQLEGPAYLESSNDANLPLYRRFGFEQVRQIVLPGGGPHLWAMLRP